MVLESFLNVLSRFILRAKRGYFLTLLISVCKMAIFATFQERVIFYYYLFFVSIFCIK